MPLILSLDDDPEMGHLLSLILERAGYEVIYTADSYEAWALLHSLPVDLLTQDILRLDINGHDYYHLLQADPVLRAIPVLFISATAGLPVGAALAADGYLPKPPRTRELLAAIEGILVQRGKPLPTAAERRQGENLRVLDNPAPDLAALAAPDSFIRRRAIRRLGYSKAADAVEPLLDLLAAPEVEVRLEAARVLGQLGDSKAGPPLLGRLDDPDWRVRWAAAQALGQLKIREALPGLAAALAEPHAPVCMMAALALSNLADAPAVERLAARLVDEDVMVRRAVRIALNRLAQAEDPDARRLAAETRRCCAERQAVLALLAGLCDEPEEVRRDVVYAADWHLVGDWPAIENFLDYLYNQAGPAQVLTVLASWNLLASPRAIAAGSGRTLAGLIQAARWRWGIRGPERLN